MENPFKRTYEQTEKVEKATTSRDFFYLQVITKDKYAIEQIVAKEMQWNGIDFLLADKEAPADGKKYILLDRKTSKKIKRDSFIFELYYQYEGKPKRKSWSLLEPKTDNTMMIAFIDEMQVVTVGRKQMINALKLLEKEEPQLISKKDEINKHGIPVKKYIVTLSKDDDYFNLMKPRVYDMTEKYYLFNDIMKNWR